MYVVEVFWESPKNQKSKHSRWVWVELAMVGDIEACWGFDYLVIILQEEEAEKESLAWKVLTEEQTQSMKELTVHELEVWVHRFDFTLFEENLHIYTQVLYKFERLTMVHKLNVLLVDLHFFTHHWESL